MNIIESVEKRGETANLVRLQCGHKIITANPHVRAGNAFYCPECNHGPEERSDPQPCTDAQLDAVAADYAETMRARGVSIGKPEEVAIRRAAAIQDTWRVAFARVLGSGEQKAIEYSIKLQRLIENLKYDTAPLYPELHHHKMIVAAKARIAALEARCVAAEQAEANAFRNRDSAVAENEKFRAMLEKIEGSSRPRGEPAWQYDEIRALLGMPTPSETGAKS